MIKNCPCCGLLFEQGHLGSCAQGPECWKALGFLAHAALEAQFQADLRTVSEWACVADYEEFLERYKVALRCGGSRTALHLAASLIRAGSDPRKVIGSGGVP